MSEPLVSVIVPTYNRPDLLQITLKSMIDQTYKNIEIVVVNDCGKDVSDVIQNLNDDRIKYFTHDKNNGLAASRNTAMKNAKGDYFCWCDDDDFYLPMAIEFRMSQIKKLNAEVVYTRALQNIYELKNGKYEMVLRKLYWDMPFHRDQVLVYNIAPCLCPLFSRKAWDDSGNYQLDEDLWTSEDQDFWVALSRKNDFHELKLVDCECTLRNHPGGNMTGTRDFTKAWPVIYKRWRHTASPQNYEWVKNTQNSILISVKINPNDYGL
jgi:glycosyltransferase involved in cell wall biosynthesis